MLRKVAVFSKDNNSRTREGVQNLINECNKRNIAIQLYQKPGKTPAGYIGSAIELFSEFESLPDLPEMVLSVGGDGTFLETMLKVKDFGIPVAGVNTGRMGFLANIPGEEISNSLDLLYKNEFEIIERALLRISVPDGLFKGESATALNEITIQKANTSMITINVYVDDVYLNTYWADGLIVSTATGSTAYNLSVGGPILSPDDESIIISPISPHNLTIRPIVLSGSNKLRMVMEARSEEYLVTCDFRYEKLPINSEIRIEKAGSKLKTVMLKGTDFYSTLRNRLMWGLDKRN
jgi:NAD+ kinase